MKAALRAVVDAKGPQLIPCEAVVIFEVPSTFIVFALSAKMPPCPLTCDWQVRMQLLLRVTVS